MARLIALLHPTCQWLQVTNSDSCALDSHFEARSDEATGDKLLGYFCYAHGAMLMLEGRIEILEHDVEELNRDAGRG